MYAVASALVHWRFDRCVHGQMCDWLSLMPVSYHVMLFKKGALPAYVHIWCLAGSCYPGRWLISPTAMRLVEVVCRVVCAADAAAEKVC